MKLKLTLRRTGAPDADLLVTLDVNARIGDLAEHLARADPAAGPQPPDRVTLRTAEGAAQALDPDVPVADSGLHSGMTVALTRHLGGAQRPRAESDAVLHVATGPNAGARHVLRLGRNTIGRQPGSDILLNDRLVSRHHAHITVARDVEITDLGSDNGVQVGDRDVARTVLRGGDRIRIGDTELVLQFAAAPPGTGTAERAVEGFIRPPRLEPRRTQPRLTAPEPPAAPQNTRPPLIPMLSPLLFGGVMFAVSGRAGASLAFAALSPLMSAGYALESALSGRSRHKRDTARFRAELGTLAERAQGATEAERADRVRAHPPLDACVEAIRQGSDLLWCRRPGERGFGEFRLGTGRQPAGTVIEQGAAGQAPARLLAERDAVLARFAHIDDVPVVAVPAEDGAIGLAGPREQVLGAARALITQAAALHSPAELVVAAFASSHSAPDWDWLKWLPHTHSPHHPLPEPRLAATGPQAAQTVSHLEALRASRQAAGTGAGVIPAVLVLVDADTPADRSRLVELAEHGAPLGIYVLWVAADTSVLPAACRTVVAYGSRQPGNPGGAGAPAPAEVRFLRSGELVAPLAGDWLDAPSALALARRLAPVADIGARAEDESDLPRSVSLLSVARDPMRPAAAAIVQRWQANRSILTGPYAPSAPPRKAGTLRAVIGTGAAGPLSLDLRADGPHALVGGTTGAGKSELLQTWILALAGAHSPQRLTFLLVDYKGGSAFSEAARLPHTVGMVTDLDQHLVRRALTSLRAELHYRERLFARHNHAKDLVELEKQGSLEAPPSLVIVVDEFAALVKELPDFVDGMINVAQRGRSLGVHLILATQRPAGVITQNLRANTNLRVALRMADEADSHDVLGSREAAFFDPAMPGRAVSKTGPGRLVPFQTAYVGGWTTDEPPAPSVRVQELGFGAGAEWEYDAPEGPADRGPTDLVRLVDAIGAAHREALLPDPRLPWLPGLKPCYDLAALLRGERQTLAAPTGGGPEGEHAPDDGGRVLVFGIQDDPEHQDQPIVAFRPDVDGNLAVYGTGGSGKSTLLRTLAVSAGFGVYEDPCRVYGLDFGAGGLSMLEELPYVGSIVPGDDEERVIRLLTELADLVAARKPGYAKANAGRIADYRLLAERGDEPRVLLLVDGFPAFRQAYEVAGDRGKAYTMLVAVATEGRAVGVHVLLSADRPNSVPSGLAATIQARVTLRMADNGDYAGMGVAAGTLNDASPAGRGVLRGAEIQVAVLGDSPGVGAQADAVRWLAHDMRADAVPAAPPVRSLPALVPMADLPAGLGSAPVLGTGYRDLLPAAFQPHGTFLVCGPPGSGRSSSLRALAVALLRWNPRSRLFLLGTAGGRPGGPDLWTASASGPSESMEVLSAAAKALAEPQGAPVALFVENLAAHAAGPMREDLLAVAQACQSGRALMVAEGETRSLLEHSALVARFRSGSQGLLLAPDASDGAVFPGVQTGRLNRDDFPPGRGLLLRSGKSGIVQVGWVPEPWTRSP